MGTAIYRSIVLTLGLGLLLCGVYPLAILGVGKLFFGEKAQGSLLRDTDGKPLGSALLGQVFVRPQYFHPRPSSAGAGYDAANSSGSNLGPTSEKLAAAVKANVETVLKENPSLKRGEIPVDMVTASGSGLDPHISPENALAQLPRVAGARKLAVERVRQLIASLVQKPQLGLFGEPVVNVLALNIELDHL